MKIFLLTLMLMVANRLIAADAYFIRFSATGHGNAVGTRSVVWRDDIILFNTTKTTVNVQFLGVSNGGAQADTPPLTLAPGLPVSLNASPVNQQWAPVGAPALWELHLDIPAGVIAESRDEFYVTYDTGVSIPPQARGKVSMPVFRQLTPANAPQIYLGTDLSANDSRTNIAVYNAGTDTATATIELRRVCDQSLADARTITVPPNVLLQTGGLSAGPRQENPACPGGASTQWEMYTVITLSQPSLTYVSNINDSLQSAPGESGYVPVIGLAVASNRTF